ncbi:MAG: FAD-dependent oxidoreductase [Candidatus Moranbacteria bacterium]|nr:FAD-dependent oxidoreductase [Candidatus Moranbacteria bacterium]
MAKPKIVIIGGGAAGTTCAFELRKLDKEAEITIVEKTGNAEYCPCALPYVLAGEIKSFDDIFIFQKSDYENNNIRLLLNTTVVSIDKKGKKINCRDSKKTTALAYDKLVLAAGSAPKFPPIPGLEKAIPLALKTIDDAKRISQNASPGGKNRAVVVGAGLVGLELAAALSKRGEKVSLIEARDRLLPAVLDKDMGEQAGRYAESLGIETYLNAGIEKIDKNKVCFGQNSLPFDKLYICAGMKASAGLAKQAGLDCGEAVEVNRRMQTSDKDIYACGDCVFSQELNTGEKVLSQLGTVAVRQGKTAARNLLGGKETAPPVLNTTITKVGELFIGSAGLTLERARQKNLRAMASKYTTQARSEYYPSSSPITVKLVFDQKGKLLGGQIIGKEEVAGRIDLLSLAIGKGMNLDDLIEMETCYNPASAPINEPLTVAAEIGKKKLNTIKNE